MKLSTKGRYGLRAMVDLAVYSNDGHVALYNVAIRQEISQKYLEQIFPTLKKAKLVISVKGAKGGYKLARDIGDITVGEILQALEGDLSLVNETTGTNNMIGQCIKTNVWDKLNSSVLNIVNSVTLKDLVDEFNELNNKNTYIYHI